MRLSYNLSVCTILKNKKKIAISIYRLERTKLSKKGKKRLIRLARFFSEVKGSNEETAGLFYACGTMSWMQNDEREDRTDLTTSLNDSETESMDRACGRKDHPIEDDLTV